MAVYREVSKSVQVLSACLSQRRDKNKDPYYIVIRKDPDRVEVHEQVLRRCDRIV